MDQGEDRVFAFDYEHSGKRDYLVCYRPGGKAIWILKNNNNGTFSPVIQSSGGIGGFDLSNGVDKVIAFDYEHSGKMDYLAVYRSGGRLIWFLKNMNNGTFSAVLKSFSGLGGYDFASSTGSDQAFAFDYDHSGKMDNLVCFNNTTYATAINGVIISSWASNYWILNNNDNGTFGNRYQTTYGVTIAGSGAYPIYTQSTTFDYDHTGRQEYLIIYQPGYKSISINKNNNNGTLTQIFQSASGIGGFDLSNGLDRMFAFDYDHSGKQDYLFIYRPGGSAVWILHNNNDGTFTKIF